MKKCPLCEVNFDEKNSLNSDFCDSCNNFLNQSLGEERVINFLAMLYKDIQQFKKEVTDLKNDKH